MTAPVGAAKDSEPLEVWALLAYVVAALSALVLVYLGLRPGGSGPILAWGAGRDLLQLSALALFCTGAIWSFFHRPFLRRRRRLPFLALALVIGAGGFPFPYPSSHEGHESQVCFRLPFEGEWKVYWGGESKEENLLAGFSADRRWGLDLVVEKEGSTHEGRGLRSIDHYCYGRDVLAPADGTVVIAVGSIEDTPPGWIDRRADACGNRVVIQVAEAEFVFLCHLQKGSLAVALGQRVKAGDRLGRVGSTGWSTVTPEPHLAIHLQDTPDAGRGEPVPWRFCDYLADGVRVEKGLPRGGIGLGGARLGQRIAPFVR